MRVFLDEGPAMAALLGAAAKHGIARDYVRRLRHALRRAEDRAPPDAGPDRPAERRELDVLRLLATDLGGRPSPASSSCR